MIDKNNPLKPDDLEKLNRLLKSCAATKELLNKCTACGLNVEKEVYDNNQQIDVASKIKATFFPDQP